MRDTARRRFAFVSGAVLVAAVLAAFWFGVIRPRYQTDVLGQLGQGDYQLVTTAGEPFTADTLDGAPSAIFFGFTHCPDVCPTTLGDIAVWVDALAEEGLPPIRAYLLTVDPERDTPEVLGEYVSWVPEVTGVTGTPEEVEKAVQAFRVYAAKVPLEGDDYTMDHSAMVLLFDADGRFVEPISYQEPTDSALAALRRAVGA